MRGLEKKLKQRTPEDWSEKEEIGARGNTASGFLLSSTVTYLFHSNFILRKILVPHPKPQFCQQLNCGWWRGDGGSI